MILRALTGVVIGALALADGMTPTGTPVTQGSDDEIHARTAALDPRKDFNLRPPLPGGLRFGTGAQIHSSCLRPGITTFAVDELRVPEASQNEPVLRSARDRLATRLSSLVPIGPRQTPPALAELLPGLRPALARFAATDCGRSFFRVGDDGTFALNGYGVGGEPSGDWDITYRTDPPTFLSADRNRGAGEHLRRNGQALANRAAQFRAGTAGVATSPCVGKAAEIQAAADAFLRASAQATNLFSNRITQMAARRAFGGDEGDDLTLLTAGTASSEELRDAAHVLGGEEELRRYERSLRAHHPKSLFYSCRAGGVHRTLQSEIRPTVRVPVPSPCP